MSLIFLLEIFFQITFFFDIKNFKKTILFFNPYCDQPYWNYQGISSYDETKYDQHPILTLIKKKNKFFFKDEVIKNKKDLVFYGSSFIGHEYFIDNYHNEINFGIKSYGFDQIYQSYMLTKDNFVNKTIIIGFLLEDIDRVIFDQRNFPKLKYKKIKDDYEITNIPVSFKEKSNSLNFFTYNLIKNLFFLFSNDFNYKKSECKIENKKEIFEYFVDKIITNAKLLNQNILFITFNFKEDIDIPNWRYPFVKNLLLSKEIDYIDTIEAIKTDQKIKNFDILSYYNEKDLHLSVYGFNVVKKKIDSSIKRYK